jgi:hypothetical protein
MGINLWVELPTEPVVSEILKQNVGFESRQQAVVARAENYLHIMLC